MEHEDLIVSMKGIQNLSVVFMLSPMGNLRFARVKFLA